MDEMERPVDGMVSLELYKGGISVKGRKSAHSLYDSRLSGRDSHGAFSQKEARQFAKLHGLQDVIAYMIDAD
jgi:argininosuccinate synthase